MFVVLYGHASIRMTSFVVAFLNFPILTECLTHGCIYLYYTSSRTDYDAEKNAENFLFLFIEI